jgi:hypothetical protein
LDQSGRHDGDRFGEESRFISVDAGYRCDLLGDSGENFVGGGRHPFAGGGVLVGRVGLEPTTQGL